VLDSAVEIGATFWDTADVYGDNEDLVGKWFVGNRNLHISVPYFSFNRFKRTGNRNKIFIATKCGITSKLGELESGGEMEADSSPEYVKSSCQKSLDRLGIDQIDLFYIHVWFLFSLCFKDWFVLILFLVAGEPSYSNRGKPSTTDIEPKTNLTSEENHASYGRTRQVLFHRRFLIASSAEPFLCSTREGKIRYVGLSEVSATTLRRAHAVHPVAAFQFEYSPFFLDIEDEEIGLLKTCRELGIKVVPYSPLGRGLLTGRYKSPDDFEPTDIRRIVPKYGIFFVFPTRAGWLISWRL
jgi:aryl-alcohol dehydrogenase-like predicted oxidoreductase